MTHKCNVSMHLQHHLSKRQHADCSSKMYSALPGSIKAGSVSDDNNNLALSETNIYGSGGDLGGRLVGGDDLQELHLVDGGEVVHPDDHFRSL